LSVCAGSLGNFGLDQTLPTPLPPLQHATCALGAAPEEIMEAIWVAAEVRAGGAFAHSALALDALDAASPHGEVTA
jgi:alkylhydroperoxidase/carboxymuconolactone decarboxylase family protein YurZ